MPLVDYGSDSDSDSGLAPPPPPAAKPKPSTASSLSSLLPKPKAKQTTSLLASSSLSSSNAPREGGPRKIIVNLPKLDGGGADGNDVDGPPSKRARISGSGTGLGGGLASMLPAPKKRGTGPTSSISGSGSGNGNSGVAASPAGAVGLGMARKERVLGGGAARREDEGLVLMPGDDYGGGEDGNGDSNELAGPQPPPTEGDIKAEEVKKSNNMPAPQATQFLPQSVSRKAIQPASAFLKKKKKGHSSLRGASAGGTGGGALEKASVVQEKPKPKVSLFGAVPSSASSTTTSASSTTTKEYKPLLVTSVPPPSISLSDPTDSITYDPNAQYTPSDPTNSDPNSNSNDLHSLATSLGLDASSMRQLLGRSHRSSSSTTTHSTPTITTFDVNTEYASNTILARDQAFAAAASVNPVRSIAPGKHQLTQLLNAAQSQKGALEEHFAEGKRNRKEAGGKYGW